ncbi:hypothetical protein ABGB12_30135 [Actinocorallia sp. B10E7]|uniref:hypothetical protein n=1 Tax=Actinocorallia sp. B10E7 TaxID=3153558 RepID=UPI00325F4E0F
MTLPDLDELIAEVDRTCANAYRPDDSQPGWLALLRTGTGLAGLNAVGRGVSSTVLGELPIDAGTLLRSRA